MKITDITKQYDVCVCGGGPAGVCAAIAAAEAGADTVLIEKNGMLGGIWTSGLLSWILDCKGKNGILRRLMTRLEEEGTGRFARGGNFLALPENTKLALEDMALSAGVNILLYTQICSAKTENGRIKSVKCCGKEGLFDLSAKVFIDCTGDGDLGFFAGCTYAYGGEDGRAQPMTLVALVDGIDPAAAHKFDNALPYPEGKPNAKAVTLSHMRSLGIEPTYGSPSLWHISDSLWLMMTQQEYGYDPAKSASLSAATLEARRELDAQVKALRAGGGVFSKMRLVMTAPSIGVRESRRLLGKYTLSDSDLAEGKTFDDAVCEVRFGVDIHPTASGRTFEEEKKNYTVKPYEIPLRCLLSAEFDNLLMAGRCISGSFAAHASYRVTGDAAVTGEAAGRKAAQMAKA